MDENIPQNTPKTTNITLWIVLAVVGLITIGAVLYYGDYSNSNTNSNTNTVLNTNTETNRNVAVNTNTVSNQNNNSATNTNTSVDMSSWKYYEEPNEYQIKFPTYWTQTGSGGNLGNELIQLWRFDQNGNDTSIDGQSPNSAKVTLNINQKESNTLDQLVDQYLNQTDPILNVVRIVSSRESTTINGKDAIRVSYTYQNSVEAVFIDYKDNKYVSIIGMRGIGDDEMMLKSDIEHIQGSFSAIN